MMTSWGIVEFDPSSRANPKRGWAIVRCCNDLGRYYRSFLNRRYRADFQVSDTVWGSHISLVREEDSNSEQWEIYKSRPLTISFYYSNIIETNWKHFWLPVEIPEARVIRRNLNLPELPKFPFHLTIGVMPGDYSFSDPSRQISLDSESRVARMTANE